ncbi:MAG TPA: Fe-S protein assembly chaperone HscA [Gammaproteobacteria bacterium]
MALLQISEPGKSTPPHEHRLAIGIDLGTTHSLVATVGSAVPRVIADEQGGMLLPSIVRYRMDGTVEVGAVARTAAIEDPVNTIVSVKRLVGRSLQDIRDRYPHIPYEFIENAEAVPSMRAGTRTVNAVEVSAEILRVLRQRAEAALGGELRGAVITVPAYFDDGQRQATKEAARLAGLQVLRLLNEPTAAAVAYGLDRAAGGRIAIYDLGGGTFDISILNLERGVFQVLATGGDTALGGDDFDALIAGWVAQQAGIEVTDKSLRRALLEAAVQAKERLSVQQTTELDIDLGGGNRWRGKLDRQTLETLISPLLDRTLKICQRALHDSGLKKTDIDEVVMVGGSTRIPLVREKTGRFFQRTVLTDIDPDQVVALGAAVQADILVGNKSTDEMLLLDVTPLSLGIETMGGLVEKIIPRNSALPIAKSQEFTTFKDGQASMAIHVVQGEREVVSACRSLARFELRNIPPLPAGVARIRVTFQVDADGLLSVSAEEVRTGATASVQVKPSFGLSDAEITAMLQASIEHAESDMTNRRLQEHKIEAERVLAALDAALREDSAVLPDKKEKASILAARETLLRIKAGDDPQAIRQAIKSLETASEAFVMRRMNASIRRAVAGHRVDEY